MSKTLNKGEYYILEISAHPRLECGGKSDAEEYRTLKNLSDFLKSLALKEYDILIEGIKIKKQEW